MIRAYRKLDNRVELWYIVADSSYETYQRRGSFKRAGLEWDYDSKHWIATRGQLKELGIPRMIACLVTICHDRTAPYSDRMRMLVPENKAIEGAITPAFCGLCDSHYKATILEVLDV